MFRYCGGILNFNLIFEDLVELKAESREENVALRRLQTLE